MMARTVWGFVAVAGVLIVGLGTSQAQIAACTGDNCIKASVVSPEGSHRVGESVNVPVTFAQGVGAGVDNIAAIALTLNIPGLKLSTCDNPTADGIVAGAMTIPTEVGEMFRVVVENTVCTDPERDPPLNRNHCLCPGDGQTRDEYVNIVVFGPKTLPTPGSGPVEIPKLPDGVLISLNLAIASTGTTAPCSTDASKTCIPLHLFAETDTGSQPAKPQFGAYLSVGNQQAVDETADRETQVSKVLTNDGEVQVVGGVQCTGDCNGDCVVDIGEITTGVNDLLNDVNPATNCPFGYEGPLVDIGAVTTAVNNLLNDCPSSCVPRQ